MAVVLHVLGSGLGCPYSLGCDADIIETDHILMAKRLAKLEGERAQLIKALKAATTESAITFDGTTVGYQVATSRTPKPGALTLMWLAWTAANGDVSGLLAALKPTMAMLSSVAKKLYPDSKEDQAAIVAQWSREEQGKEFESIPKEARIKHRVHQNYQVLLDRRTFCQSRPAVERMTQMRKPAQPGARRRSQAKGAVWGTMRKRMVEATEGGWSTDGVSQAGTYQDRRALRKGCRGRFRLLHVERELHRDRVQSDGPRPI